MERGDIIFGKTRLPEREVRHAVAHYDGEVAYADAAIGDLMKALEDLGELDRTIIVLTADHGENLGEHDYFFEHGAYLYEATVRVPLIVRAPGLIPPGRVVSEQARTIDIVPTVLELAGLPIRTVSRAGASSRGPGARRRDRRRRPIRSRVAISIRRIRASTWKGLPESGAWSGPIGSS